MTAYTHPHTDESPPTPAAVQIDAADATDLPTSWGVFKPVGHVMVGLPSQAQSDALVLALRTAGWSDAGVRQFAPGSCVIEFQAMVAQAGVLAGFGYEITLLRRYLRLAEEGGQFVLVKADDEDRAAAAAKLAKTCNATVAAYYRLLVVEELIT
jgi:hypothetical protein